MTKHKSGRRFCQFSLQNLRFRALVLPQILLAISQVLQKTHAPAPSPTRKDALQLLRRSHSKTCNITQFSSNFRQNLQPLFFGDQSLSDFPSIPATKTTKPATHSSSKPSRSTNDFRKTQESTPSELFTQPPLMPQPGVRHDA